MEKGWKLKLRYGLLKTNFKHFTLIAEGLAQNPIEDFSCPKGPAFMGMEVWATDEDEAINMIQSIGNDIGFTVTGRIQLYSTPPSEPPGENPSGYDIKFTPFDAE